MRRLTTLRRSFPTARLLVAPFRWIGKSRRRILGTVLILLAIPAVPLLWWAMQLWGLPDIGEPFDIAAFRSRTIPEDRNAVVLYRQAERKLKPISQFEKHTTNQVDPLARWSKTTPEIRRWLEANHEALELYRQGTKRPDALDLDSRSDGRVLDHAFWALRNLALLEGSRREDLRDMAGAWIWYRANLRYLDHIGMHGADEARQIAQMWQQNLRERVAAWAADPRTTPVMIRQAIDDVAACESLAPSELDTLKLKYLNLVQMLDDPKSFIADAPPAWLLSVASGKSAQTLLAFVSPEQMRSIVRACRSWRRETDRSRRVIRLLVANWLAYYELPAEGRPKPDLEASSIVDIYAFGSNVPAKARALSSKALGRWLETIGDAQIVLRMLDLRTVRIREWANQNELLILLGTALYRRDHGKDPPSPEALVGPYLKSLPGDLPDDGQNQAEPSAGTPVE
jgi:hypothetical protein